jgi:hypothetical protein
MIFERDAMEEGSQDRKHSWLVFPRLESGMLHAISAPWAHHSWKDTKEHLKTI